MKIFLLLYVLLIVKVESQLIQVPNGGPWGSWGSMVSCPVGTKATGFSLKVEDNQQASDKTALNGIRLHCNGTTLVTSKEGSWGSWKQHIFCWRGGFLTSFSLRVQKRLWMGDDTAANNIVFKCSNGELLDGDGLDGGEWGKWSDSCMKGICGIQTKVEGPQGFRDDTALNDVRFLCCDGVSRNLK